MSTSIQKQHSETFHSVILESSPDCLKLLDKHGRLQFMNFNGLCQMEIDDFGQFKNQEWWELWGEDNKELVKNAVDMALKGEVAEFTAFCATAKGTPKWWQVTVTPVKSSTQEIYQLLSVSRDISLQKKAEEDIRNLNNQLEERVRIRTQELMDKNNELEKINRELAMFTHIASHDLQEPLRKIQLYSGLIIDSPEDISNSRAYLNKIISSAGRMSSLIKALNNYSLCKNAEVYFEDCDLNDILQKVVRESEGFSLETGVEYSIHSLPAVKGSPDLLYQLFANLLQNASKFRKPHERLHIKVSGSIASVEKIGVSNKFTANSYEVVTFTDNGIGFSNEYRNLVFEIFKKLHSRDEYAGTGMGLAICKTIMEAHGGWIEADSESGVGTSFLLYFPKEA